MDNKTHKKSSTFWKHGKHKGLQTVAINANKNKKPRRGIEPLDFKKENWTGQGGKRTT